MAKKGVYLSETVGFNPAIKSTKKQETVKKTNNNSSKTINKKK